MNKGTSSVFFENFWYEYRLMDIGSMYNIVIKKDHLYDIIFSVEVSMVTFKILYKTDTEIRYEYYPEDDKNSIAGLIGINVVEDTIELLQPAERDRMRIIKAEELNSMRDSINEMRKENGEPPLSEEELPTATEDSKYYQYAFHAIRKINEAYEDGRVLEEGMAAWY